jgi:serine protease inhibitor
MATKGMPGEPLQVTVVRPFIFTIRDNQTGAGLFVGRVVDPS